MKTKSALLFLPCAALAGLTLTAADWTDPRPLPRAHAHNDYEHPRPCLDALAHGFTSVEADIYLVGDDLLVAHDREDLRPERTLERLYLEPLRQRVEKNDGRVHPGGERFTLLIDIKSEAEPTYRALAGVLGKYASMLTHVNEGRVHAGAVTVVVSGNRPQEIMAAETTRYAGIDGRLSDLDSDKPAHLMPLISDRWTSHFRWRGEGPLPPAESAKLAAIIEKAHAAGRRIRFWATPDRPEVWRALYAARVDHINTDDLCGLQRFLLAEARKKDAVRR